jgi:hypothetical protein
MGIAYGHPARLEWCHFRNVDSVSKCDLWRDIDVARWDDVGEVIDTKMGLL